MRNIRFPISIGLLLLCHLPFKSCDVASDKLLEKTLMTGYNSRARPVKVDTTVTKVTVFLNIAHIEKVNEIEQTMLVHGHIWASWTDEYLTWNKEDYNGTTKVQIQAWRIWQPALALYNSAKGNSWHLYMNGLPATVYNTGKVWASGTYSFYVTCQFDFSNWPFDSQRCPIVVADWVYSLAQVNLSDPEGFSEYIKPTIRLSYDPVEKNEKKHVGGWEVKDTWKKHCYWGPKGCKDEQPEGQSEWYWSLLEFGVVIKRHVPYLGVTLFVPLVLSTFLILATFWIDTFSVSISVVVFNLLLEGVYGWEMISHMPPGSGSIPKIVQIYSANLILTTFNLFVIVIFKFIEDNMPSNYEMNIGFEITDIPKKLRLVKLFETKGVSFDPQELMGETNTLEDILENGNSNGISIDTMSDAFNAEQNVDPLEDPNPESNEDTEMLVQINLPSNPSSSSEHPELPSTSDPSSHSLPVTLSSKLSKLQLQLHTLKRSFFITYLLAYALMTIMIFVF